jgi:signal transduction histidine kinase
VRRRILLLVVGMTVLVVLAFAIPLVVLVRNNAYDDGKRSLSSAANDVERFLRSGYSARASAQITARLALEGDRDASVQLPGGTVLGTVPPGGFDRLPALPAIGAFGTQPSSSTPESSPASNGSSGAGGDPFGLGRGASPISYAGGQLVQSRVLPLGAQPGDQQFYIVRVWASDGQLHSGDDGSLSLIGGVAVALLLLGVIAGEVLTRRIVRPLVDTAHTAQQLSAGDTTARAPTDGPVEVADVGRALNRLADRIDQLIAEERETVADMSHRLRTPLTAMRLDAESLPDPDDAERMGGHVSALERMLTAVIRAARRPQREGRLPSCDATAVVGRRVAFWSALAEDQERASTVDLPNRPLIVRAAADDLAAAVDALLENVIAHTPEGTPFAVRLTDAGGVHLEVSDDGPGLPPDAHVRGRSDRGSSGLGLDIARRCAEASGGSMTLGSAPSGGARIRLDLGTP